MNGTKGLHSSNRAPWNKTAYDPTQARFFGPDDNFEKLSLSGFLNAMQDPWIYQWWEVNTVTMHCAAYAAILHQAMATQGYRRHM